MRYPGHPCPLLLDQPRRTGKLAGDFEPAVGQLPHVLQPIDRLTSERKVGLLQTMLQKDWGIQQRYLKDCGYANLE